MITFKRNGMTEFIARKKRKKILIKFKKIKASEVL